MPNQIKQIPNQLNIIAWNANGLKPKIQEFREFLPRLGVDVALISETHLKPGHRVGVSNYCVYRNDRETGRGGGTAIFIKKSITHNELITPSDIQIEATLIQISTNNGKIIVGSLYNPPKQELRKTDLETLFNIGNRTILAGDLNAKNPEWHSLVINPNGRRLKRYSDELDIIIDAPQTPTRYSNIEHHRADVLDIVTYKGLTISQEIKVINELSSDHFPINFTWGTGRGLNRLYVEKHRTDWKKFTDHLSNFSLPVQANLDNKVAYLQQNIQEAHDLATKSKLTLETVNEIPTSIMQLIRERRKAIKEFKRTQCPRDKTKLNTLTHQVRTALDEHHNNQWQNKLEGLNTEDGTLWSLGRSLRRRRDRVGVLVKNEITAITDLEKAEMFASSLDEVANSVINNKPIHKKILKDLEIDRKRKGQDIHPATVEEIQGHISALAKRKSPGLDKITNITTKHLPFPVVKALTEITNEILTQQKFPKVWKTAKVVVIHKKGKDKSNPENYRPISLLSTLSKLVERVILNRLNDEITDLDIIPPEQFGFREGHGTELQLLRLVETIHQAIDNREVAEGIFLDVKRAFDKVWHDGLIAKLYQHNINPGLVNLISDYLRDRKFQVIVGDSLSTPRTLRAGVAQGSVISPTLYNLYTADFPKCDSVSVFSYADDVALISTDRNEKYANMFLQKALKEINSYFSKWKITINAEKSQHIFFTTRILLSNCKLKINHKEVPKVSCVKYLGVHIDQCLNWGKQVTATVKKGQQAFGMLYPMLCRDSRLSSNNKLLIYKQMIRPILTYGSLVWGTAAKIHINRLQILQNKCIRVALNAPYRSNMGRIHKELGIKSIQDFVREMSIKKLKAAEIHINSLISQSLTYQTTYRPRRNRPKTFLLPPPDP